MGGVGHAVALVEYNELDALAHELLSAAEALDFFADDVDAPVVGGIEFEGHVAVILPIKLLRNRDHAGGLAGAGRAVK